MIYLVAALLALACVGLVFALLDARASVVAERQRRVAAQQLAAQYLRRIGDLVDPARPAAPVVYRSTVRALPRRPA